MPFPGDAEDNQMLGHDNRPHCCACNAKEIVAALERNANEQEASRRQATLQFAYESLQYAGPHTNAAHALLSRAFAVETHRLESGETLAVPRF